MAFLVGLVGDPAEAQTTLPTIVVETPSPISTPTPPGDPAGAAQPGTAGPSFPLPGIIVDDSFVPVTIATDWDVLTAGSASLAGNIDTRPGIIGSTFAPGSSRPIIRGLDNYRVRVQEIGIGTHDVSALSEDHGVPVDPFSAEKIEIIRGPATLRYGSQAIGGVVSIESGRIPTRVPRHGYITEIKGGLSSVDKGADGAFRVTAGAAGFVLHADGSKVRTEDYDTPNGRQFNTFVNKDTIALGASYVWNQGFLGLAYIRHFAFYGIPGEEAGEHRPRIDMEQDKLLARGEWRPGAAGIHAIRFWFGSSDYAHNEVIDEDGLDLIGTRFTNKEWEGRVELEHLPIATLFGELRGAFGLQTGNRKTHGFPVAEPVDGLLDPAETKTIAGFWFEELRVTQALRLQAAARIDQRDVEGSGIIFNPLAPAASGAFAGKRSFTGTSGSLGALYELPGAIVAALTVQSVDRLPAEAELFSKGVHEATETFEIGNPFLEKETARTIEFGLRKAKGKFRFDATAYYTRFDGFIYKELDGTQCGEDLASCGVEDELDLAVFQQRDATFYGLEMAAQFDVARIWNGIWGIDGQYDMVRARFSGAGNVPRIPPHRLGGGVYYKDPNWYARAGVLHAFEQDKIGLGEVVTPGYTLVSAELSYTKKLAQGGLVGTPMPTLTIGVKGKNLADDDVLNHASFKRREEVLLPGASVRVFGSIKWN